MLVIFCLNNCCWFALWAIISAFFQPICSFRLSPTSLQTGDQFGGSLASYNDLLAVGARFDDYNGFSNAGTVHLYMASSSSEIWTAQGNISDPSPENNGNFGYSVSVSGNTMVIGKTGGAGKALVFSQTMSGWSFNQTVTPSGVQSGDNCGSAVAVNQNEIIIGCPNYQNNEGLVFVLNFVDNWTERGTLIPAAVDAQDKYGSSLSCYGDNVVVGSPSGNQNRGAVYICSQSSLTCPTTITPTSPQSGDSFGQSVSIYDDYLVVGAPFRASNGQVIIYNMITANNWIQVASFTGATTNEGLGSSVSLYDTYLAAASPLKDVGGNTDEGSVTWYSLQNSLWTLIEEESSPDASLSAAFGTMVALSADFAVVSATGLSTSKGAVYTYKQYSNPLAFQYTCPSGQGKNPADGGCSDCAVGKYQAGFGETCLNCEGGKYNAMTGQQACVSCVAGKSNPNIGSVSSLDCVDCLAGSFSVGAQTTCTGCVPGKYGTTSASVSESDCISCPMETFQNNAGSTNCIDCGFGTCTYGTTGNPTCDVCDLIYAVTQVSGCAVDLLNPLATANCPTKGGVELTITGTWNFSDLAEGQATIGGKICPITLLESFTTVRCALPSGVGSDIEVKVQQVSTGLSGKADYLSYVSPLLLSMHGCDDTEDLPDPDGTSACSRDGSDEVTVTGNNFGPDQASALIGGVMGTLISLSARGFAGWEQNTTIVQVPAGSGLGVGVNVLQKGGELSDGVRMLSYKSCGVGYYNYLNQSLGYYGCVECASGYYNTLDEVFSCLLCPKDFFCNSSTVAYSCNALVGGSVSIAGSTDSSDCYCESGFSQYQSSCVCSPGYGYDISGDCLECADDTIKVTFGNEACSSCTDFDINAIANQTTSCMCKAGYALVPESLLVDADDPSYFKCVKCDAGMVCEEGSVLTNIGTKAGYWRESQDAAVARACLYQEACSGSLDIAAQCEEGYEGVLCASCEDGYTTTNSYSECNKCFQSNHVIVFGLVLLFIVSFLCCVMLLAMAPGGSASNFISMLRALSKNRGLRVQAKVLLAYFQIISAFQSVLSTALPTNYTRFLTIMQITSLSFGSIFSPRCFNPSFDFYDELIARTILPILIGFMLFGIYLISLMIDWAERSKAKNDFLSRIFLSSFIFFPSASTAVFQTFNCDYDFESGSSYLKADYRLECDGPKYESYRNYALFMMLVYPIGIPLFYYVLLVFQYARINMDIDELGKGGEWNVVADSPQDKEEISKCSSDYRQIENVSFQCEDNQIALFRVKRELSRRMIVEYARAIPSVSPYSALFGAYRPEVWYFECVECLRRLALTGLLVFMYPGTEKQILLAMVFCMFFIILYTWQRPYLNPTHNSFMLAAQWGILLQLYGVLIVSRGDFDVSSTILGGAMIGVGVGIPFIPFMRSHYFVRLLAQIQRSLGREKMEVPKKSNSSRRLVSMRFPLADSSLEMRTIPKK